jgi:hypothetical protein
MLRRWGIRLHPLPIAYREHYQGLRNRTGKVGNNGMNGALEGGMLPRTPNRNQVEALRKLWSREGTLGGAAWRYAAMTQDYGFAVREMLREQLDEPIPGLWIQSPVGTDQHPSTSEAIFETLARQRMTVRNSRGRHFTILAQLQGCALEDLAHAQTETGLGERHVTFAELRCQDLVLMARLLVEQGAMLEAAHSLGMDHPANRDACRALFRASLDSLEMFDRKLSSGMSLAEALAVDILLESLTMGSAPNASTQF